MCGITGIFNLNEKKASERVLKVMTQALAHRGPDGEGFFVENNIGLGHRRLAILDTSSKGAQPMKSHNGRWVIVFNGCIYNFKELQKKLVKRGHRFVSTCDTEVLVEGIDEYGIDFVKELNGMFAIAAWDRKTKSLFLSRDRFGVKPLYYWFNGRSIVFASEIKAILKHPDYHVSVNLEALNEYFTFQNIFGYYTLFQGVNMLPPANIIKVDKSTRAIIHNSWWDYDFSSPDNSMTFTEAKEETKRLLAQAVKRQMISDVPVGSYLSGGMDSGSITGLASQHVDRLSTFTAGFELSKVTGIESTFDERRDAELLANHFKTEHYEQVINAGDLGWSLPRVVWHLEDLRLGMSYPNYYISRLASKFVKVCLQGTGGDELFGGYPWRYYRVFKSLNQDQFFDNYYNYWQRLVSDEDKINLFQKKVYNKIDISAPKETFKKVFTFNEKLRYNTPEDHIQNSLYFEIKTFLQGLLIVGDKLSMANGLEERFPFLDNDLVNFAQKIPVKFKLGNLEKMKKIDENEIAKHEKYLQTYEDGKNILRKAMEDILPESVLKRKKQGFSSPEESWYRGENAEYLKKILSGKKTTLSEFINPKFVVNTLGNHIHKKVNNRLLLWSLINFEWWCKTFIQGKLYE